MSEQKLNEEKKAWKTLEGDKLPCIFGSDIKDKCTVRMALMLSSPNSKGDCYPDPFPRESALVEFCYNCPHLHHYIELGSHDVALSYLDEIEARQQLKRKKVKKHA